MFGNSTGIAISLCIVAFLCVALIPATISASCKFDTRFRAKWFSLYQGTDLDTEIQEYTYRYGNQFDAKCHLMWNGTQGSGDVTEYSVESTDNDNNPCYRCIVIFFRTVNVLQFKHGSSSCRPNKPNSVYEICGTTAADSEMRTMFKYNPSEVQCRQSFEGEYHFTYEKREEGGGVCDNPENTLKACPRVGSKYIDNHVFSMSYRECPGVGAAQKQEDMRYQCLGMWIEQTPFGRANIYIAVKNLAISQIPREAYRCMMTTRDQTAGNNEVRYSMSDKAQCNRLTGSSTGPELLVLKPKVPRTDATVASCNMPVNFTGNWFTTGEYDARVDINQTHMKFDVKLDQYTTRTTVYSCQQNKGSRYLMSAVTIGKCDVDYVCFDFLPRRQNIIRFRTGRAYQVEKTEALLDDIKSRMFRRACTWLSFTLSEDTANYWKYSTLLLDPPTPVDCPITGRFSFKQYGEKDVLYQTRIRGVTQRPRVYVDCRDEESVFYSCTDTKKIMIDAKYCATVDHKGVPLWDRERYELSDYDLTCVGNFMEDARSYMITYDKEDALSPFRCWVYERLGWRSLRLSRAIRSACVPGQTPFSFNQSEGASLSLHLTENERLHDMCPIKWDDGRLNNNGDLQIVVLAHAPPTHLAAFSPLVYFILIVASLAAASSNRLIPSS